MRSLIEKNVLELMFLLYIKRLCCFLESFLKRSGSMNSDSHSQSSPTSPLTNAMSVYSHEIQTRNGVPCDGADNEEDADQLRAELLEQVSICKKKHYIKILIPCGLLISTRR